MLTYDSLVKINEYYVPGLLYKQTLEIISTGFLIRNYNNFHKTK